ncbi:MAG: tetratricopeptide repeat protein [Rhodocyclales bacterium]|nr:tetratricopeptide repeat protein [Rhodocyclales bacterium]
MLAQGRAADALRLADARNGAGDGIDVWQLRGEALVTLGRLDDAIDALSSGLTLEPNHIDSLLLRGAARQAMARYPEALDDYDRVLQLQQGNADAQFNCGLILAAQGKHQLACKRYELAIAARPGFPGAITQRGVALVKLGRSDEALDAFARAIELDPDFIEALRNRADLLNQLHKSDNSFAAYGELLAAYDRALAIAPDDTDLNNNRGTVLQRLGRLNDALACYEKALAIRPDFFDALNNSGIVLDALDRMEQSEARFRLALRSDPGKVAAHLNLALCLLRLGRFGEGWQEYEWRWRMPNFRRYDYGFKEPRWDGTQDLRGKTLLLTAEQGLGDTLQFVRYIPLLRGRCAKLMLLVPGPLAELLGVNFPDVHINNASKRLPEFDYHCPLLSLPLAFGTTLESIPNPGAYLQAPLDLRLEWETAHPPAATPRVGVVWAGNPEHGNDLHRSIPLTTFLPLLGVRGREYFILQKDLSEQDRKMLTGCQDTIFASDRFGDFRDTAAAIAQLDLVITVDTSVAHLAGAMGKPVWILIPPQADWRWILGRDDSPWYPTARIYRRLSETSWDSVIGQVAADLRTFAPTRDAVPARQLASGIDEALRAAVVLHNRGQLDDAAAMYAGVLQLEPDNFDANHLLGQARRRQGRNDEAEALYRHALRVRPDNVPALNNLMRLLRSAGRQEQALEIHNRLITLCPSDPRAWSERAASLLALNRHDEALENLDRALALDPDHLNALNNYAVVMLHRKRHEEALAYLDRLLAIKPDFVDGIANRGLALLGLGRPLEAIENYHLGLKLAPNSTTQLCNHGISLMAVNRHAEAIEQFHKALAIDPRHIDANWNLSLSQLALGDFANGWRQYEWRWKRTELAPHYREIPIPLWTGAEDLSGRCLFIHFEQGFGDTFQFLRYLPLLKARGARMLLSIPEAMRHLVAANFPDVEVFSGNEVLPPFDYHVAIMSLPLALGTTLATIPAANPPYLRAPKDRIAAWRRRIPRGRQLHVGLVWSGNPGHRYDAQRSLGIDGMRTLLDLPGIRFHALQKEVREGEAELLAQMPRIDPLGPDLKDFSDTAAAINQLDLVITVDTSVAHLAGAMGKPVWILLPHAADWRWLTDREDSPWYPTVRLFRLAFGEPADANLRRVRAALKDFRKARRP